MKTLIEKLHRLGTTIIEALDTEQGTANPTEATQDDQGGRSFELNTDAHHTLIEPVGKIECHHFILLEAGLNLSLTPYGYVRLEKLAGRTNIINAMEDSFLPPHECR